jgi:hypothetical protein
MPLQHEMEKFIITFFSHLWSEYEHQMDKESFNEQAKNYRTDAK